MQTTAGTIDSSSRMSVAPQSPDALDLLEPLLGCRETLKMAFMLAPIKGKVTLSEVRRTIAPRLLVIFN